MEQIKIIKEAFERQTESLYEGDFSTYANGDYVNEVQQYQWEGFHDGYRAALKQLEQPTMNEDLIKEIEEFISSNTVNYKTDEWGNFESCSTLREGKLLLAKCKTALSQVKPSIWKKYPDGKPENEGAKIITFWHSIENGEPMFCQEKYTLYSPNNFEYWCYEADLIKTIGVEE